MKIGISTATFFGKILTENALECISNCGIDVAEVFLTTFSEYKDSFTEKLAENLHGVEVFSVHSLNNHYEPELFNTVSRTREDAEEIFDMVCRGAERMGAKYYTFHGPSMLKIRNYSLDYERIGNVFNSLNERALKYGIELSYENVSWAFFNKPEFYTEISKYVHNIKGCLDIKQAMQSYRSNNGIAPDARLNTKQLIELKNYTYSFIDTMADGLVNVHLCDYDEYGKLCIPNKGIFDFAGLVDKLRSVGYSNNLMLELYSKDYNSISDITNCIEYLQEIINN